MARPSSNALMVNSVILAPSGTKGRCLVGVMSGGLKRLMISFGGSWLRYPQFRDRVKRAAALSQESRRALRLRGELRTRRAGRRRSQDGSIRACQIARHRVWAEDREELPRLE